MKQVEMFVEEKMQDIEVVRLFTDLSDYLREGAEEETFDLALRKEMVHATIKQLCELYW
jgi:hypothetical protein